MSALLKILELMAASIGATTGVVSLFISISANGKVSLMKKRDLRLELRKDLEALKIKWTQVSEIQKATEDSRRKVSGVKAFFPKGAREVWEENIAVQKVQLDAMLQNFKDLESKVDDLGPSELEDGIVKSHGFKAQLENLEHSFRESLARDDKARKYIRDLSNQPWNSGYYPDSIGF